MSTGNATLVAVLVVSALAVAWAGVSYLVLGISALGIGCYFLLLAYQLYGTASDKKEKEKRTNISPIASPARSSDGDSDINDGLLPGRRRRSTDGQIGLDSRGPNINGVKLVDWRGATVRFNDVWPFENEFFKGHVLFMLKTPEDTRYAEHFKGKQRLFEMQIQGQFKKLPEGTLHMGAELTEKMQLGIVTKMVAGTVLAFGRRVIKNMHYSFGESMKGASNPDEIELPHVTFPLTRGMDRLIVTEPGGTPPPLGKEFFETEESRLARKAGKEIEFKLGNIYSFSFHSMYLDFSRWEMVNIAGQKSIDLAQYFGESSVNIVVYDMDPNLVAGKHRKCDKRYFYHCEIVNTNLAGDDGGADTLVDNKMEEGEPSSVFVRSGDVVPLVATPADKGPVEGPWCLTDSKGYCVIRQAASPMEVNVAKVGGISAFYRSDFLCNGDVVTLRNSHTGKYLSVYKGWWLYWSSSGPNSSVSRCHFVIHGLDEAERLTVGKPFTLRSSKWHTYEIGVTDTVSSEYGGRMVGLYQTSKTKKMFQSKKSKTWLQPVLLKAQAPREDPLGVSTTARISLSHPDDEAGGGMGVNMGGTGSRSVSPARVAAEREEEEKVEGLDPFLDNAVNVTVEDIENLLEVEVPAWIEMMHRRRKKPQLAYLLRVRFRDRTDIGWIALRTGLDLALIMQMRRDRLFDSAGEKEDLSTSQNTYRLQKAGTPGLKRKSGGYPPGQRPLQHQNPADQSARLLSQLLSDITAANNGRRNSSSASNGQDGSPSDFNHPLPPSCKTALYSLLKKRNYLDVWFLTGVASDIGVTVPSRPAPLMQSMIARGLWESHWREEWMVLYHSHVSFFPSGSKKTGWFLCLHDILSVRCVDKGKTPFAGKSFMAIETLGRIHYLCFANEATRDAWMSQLNSRCGSTTYEIPSGVVLSDPREAFVLKSGEWRPSNRIILNARRMCFDITPPAFSPWQLSERALRLVYDLSPDSGTERLAAFLDLCAGFKMISLQQLDPTAEETLCFFLNVYHTLIQHALLLLGPPSSRDWSAFFSSVSYEIGGDVFSLAEIEYCIVRGKLSRPRTLPRYWPAPPNLEDDHYRYALSTDFRVNFALNCGSISGPPFVTVFRPEILDKQLDNVTVRFLDFTIKLDSKKRTITLPKVCDLYRADFSDGDMLEVVKSLLRFLDRVKWERVSWALAGVKAPIIKASPLKLKCHENLCLLVDDPAS